MRTRILLAALSAGLCIASAGQASESTEANTARPPTPQPTAQPKPAPAKASAKAESEGGVLLQALRAELERARDLRMDQAAPPYHLAYRVLDIDDLDAVAEYGGVVKNKRSRKRYLRVDLRVGDRSLDNGNADARDFASTLLSVDDDLYVLRRQIWLATDRAYKRALEVLERKRAQERNAGEKDDTADFSTEQASTTVVRDEAPLGREASRWIQTAQKLSGLLREAPHVHDGGVMVRALHVRRTFVDSDGAYGSEPSTWVQLAATARSQAEDGMNLFEYDLVTARSLQDMPSQAELEKRVRSMLSNLETQRAAAVGETYVGPVLFEGTAAGQLIRQLLAPHVLGTPGIEEQGANRITESAGRQFGYRSAFARRVGKRVAPEWLSAFDDPTRRAPSGSPLFGTYAFDDEGLPAQRVELIRKGRFLGFLMSRTPAPGFPVSNGHGRGGLAPVRARVGNLVVTSEKIQTSAELRKRALAEAKAAGEDYALVIRKLDEPVITSAYTPADLQSRSGGEVPAVLSAVKIRADGSEEPVRGISLVGLDPVQLRSLLSTGQPVVTYGYQEGTIGNTRFVTWGQLPSFAVATSITTPSLLFEEMEIAPDSSLRSSPPVIPAPPLAIRP
jgi:TldD protein